MKNFNVVRIDSKGRIIVPFHIRDYLGLKEGTELVVANNEKKELRIFPLLNGTAKMTVMINDEPGSLSKVLDALAKNKVDILMSISKTLERGKLAEWTALVDTAACKDIKKLEDELKATKVVKKAKIEEK